jgi:uncharacterized membrane protein YfcA
VDFVSLKNNIGILVAASVVGVGLSIPIGKRIPDKKFDLAVDILLALISLKILFTGVRELTHWF